MTANMMGKVHIYTPETIKDNKYHTRIPFIIHLLSDKVKAATLKFKFRYMLLCPYRINYSPPSLSY